ncbi:hypothetical protein SLNWT_6602 [Streptomyces albus]|uniref:DUF8017 domain-containing protein n=1 Tax=Streptomyces albus (strain ATCC 21838 / DSM 41398 / FERM P-419 / JCM 4703 / NBRC 107858) TaxID=1081613 RepID=A0A0B5EVY6_STRA4|nr:hypothetical protein SLNWT_6602 [Streptomyces albus]AOU81282.1 hypothetical protein SLNHY_6591 [Streptomyces albus]AYN36976.1 hypothetical protein DUI70_6483 [Streptomyces albus]
MWPGQQPPGGEQNPQDQNPYQQPGYQQPNPYQQPGYQQGNQYQQPGQQPGQPGGWSAPTVPMGSPPPPPNGGNGKQTKIVAIVAAAAVVVTAGVTGFLVLGGDKDDEAKDDKGKDKPSASASAKPSEEPDSTPTGGGDNPRGGGNDLKPTVAGWQVVVNPKWGTAFDVPPDWELQSPDTLIGFEDDKSTTGKPLITMSAPAYYKSKWCESDEDKDGTKDTTALGAVGTKGADGAKDENETAVNQVPWWVFGGYTQPDKKSIKFDKKAKSYTTKSGIKGKLARAESTNTPQKGKCASDGKALTFGFKNSKGNFVAWNLYGAKGVKDEIPEETIMKILSTVRLHGNPTG